MVRQAWNDWNLFKAYPMLYQNFYRENINWIGFSTKQGVSDVNFPIISGLYAGALRDPDDFEKATNPKLAKLINNAIMSIDPNMSYRDFAKGVAQVLIDEYGVQNNQPFKSELNRN